MRAEQNPVDLSRSSHVQQCETTRETWEYNQPNRQNGTSMMLRLTFLTLALAVSAAAVTSKPGAENAVPPLDQLLKLQADGNHKDAYDGLRRFVLEKKDASSADLVKAFNAATDLPARAQSHRRDRRVSRESRRSPQKRLAAANGRCAFLSRHSTTTAT